MKIEISRGVVENLTSKISVAGKSAIEVMNFKFEKSEEKFEVRGMGWKKIRDSEYIIGEGDDIAVSFKKKSSKLSQVYCIYNFARENFSKPNPAVPSILILSVFLIYFYFIFEFILNKYNFWPMVIFTVVYFIIFSAVIIPSIYFIFIRHFSSKKLEEYIRNYGDGCGVHPSSETQPIE